MKDYWESRFAKEGRIWGEEPSQTAKIAEQRFRQGGARSVLVPGSGYGRNAAFFAASGYSTTGVEISDAAIGLCRPVEGARYLQGSVLDLAFEGEFDAVYGFNILHLFREADRRRLLRGCARALKPDGIAFFTVFSEKETQYGRGEETEPGTFESKPGRPVHFFTDGDLRAHFADWLILETGLAEDPENHGEEGAHVHTLRFVLARRRDVDPKTGL